MPTRISKKSTLEQAHSMEIESVLSIREVDAGYGPVQVLWKTSAEWPRSVPFLRLTGPNGAGKTSLVRAISGVLDVRHGTLRMHGVDITKKSIQERHNLGLSVVPEGRGLFTGLTVHEHLRIAIKQKQKWAEINERIDALLPHLRELRQRRIETLSGGQQQMVAVARGIAAQPKILILDEPFSGLAPRVVADLMLAFKQLCESGVYVMLIEEDRNKRDETRCAWVMQRGRVTAIHDEVPATHAN